MNQINFAIALHFHQPTGNFKHIFERAYKSCYKPLLETISAYPEIKMMFHFSGCLLDYLDKEHPEAIELIKKMVSRRQIELMGGAYYEPILTALSRRDAVGQIGLMSQYIKNRFNFTPKGMWLAERVWHPRLAGSIYKTGMRYLILDDEHLIGSGIKNEDIHGYFLTGKEEEKVAVFPSSKKLRYLIPFKLPHETFDYFRKIAQKKPDILLTYGDDAEKFGEWPGTHKWVFEDHWLRNFFSGLKQNQDWIRLAHLSDYLESNQPTKIIDIPEGSYQEMTEWSGGSWLNFLSKYPESNQMYKRMQYVSNKLEKAEVSLKEKDSSNFELAKKEFYKGQCNCAYWHGVFGGLYLYHLRRAVYEHLIKADNLLDGIIKKNNHNWINIQQLGFDQDGGQECVIENKDLFIYIDPREGGVIKELDYKPLFFNLTNTLSRKKEAYHQKLLESAKPSEGAKAVTIHGDFRTVNPKFRDKLIYDKFPRSFLRAYLVKKDSRLEDFVNSEFEELGDFSSGAYSASTKERFISLTRKSRISNAEARLSKQIEIKSLQEIGFNLALEKARASKSDSLLAAEFNITMPDLDSSRYFYCIDKKNHSRLKEQGKGLPKHSFGISDSGKEFSFELCFDKRPHSAFYFPVETISQSERAYELNYQCSCILLLWDLSSKDKDVFKIDLRFLVNEQAEK